MWVLVDSEGRQVKPGDTVKDFRGDTATLCSSEPPKYSASTGRVYVSYDNREGAGGYGYYPSVFNLSFVGKP